jgi:hypothetical protein
MKPDQDDKSVMVWVVLLAIILTGASWLHNQNAREDSAERIQYCLNNPNDLQACPSGRPGAY